MVEDEKYTELKSYMGGGWKYTREIFGVNQPKPPTGITTF
jgi:hypothetical protein